MFFQNSYFVVNIMKKFLLSLILFFCFTTNSIAASQQVDVLIEGRDIPEECYWMDYCGFNRDSCSHIIMKVLYKDPFLSWVTKYLEAKGHIGIAEVFIKKVVFYKGISIFRVIRSVTVTVIFNDFCSLGLLF